MAHLKATGVRPPELDVPILPPGTEGLLQAFYDLHASRPVGMGPSAIPLSEVLAWQQVMNIALTPWEIETLMCIDRAVLSILVDSP